MKFFILGSHPSLSIAEIAAQIGKNLDFSQASKEVLLLDGIEESSESLQNRLAGTIKIVVGARLRSRAPTTDDIADAVLEKIKGKKPGKVNFGLSFYGLKRMDALGLEVKKRLKEHGLSVRYVTSKEKELSSVVVSTNRLLESGGEYALIAAPSGVFLGQTEAIQDFRAWSERDYGRPRRDAHSGMLPPKLARMMINLAGVDPRGKTLLDPFCGSGTVLMEAALLGFTRLIGSDISKKAIEDSRANLEWALRPAPDGAGLRNKKQQPRTDFIVSPAAELPKRLREPVDLIVTETWLGPPNIGRQSPEARRKLLQPLRKTYAEAMAALSTIIKSGGKMVVALPAYRSGAKTDFVAITPEIDGCGLKVIEPFPASLPDVLKQKTPGGGLFYARPDQSVGREIIVFEKK